MEGEGEPVELARLKRDLGVIADDYAATGAWLARAMEGSWDAAARLRHPASPTCWGSATGSSPTTGRRPA